MKKVHYPHPILAREGWPFIAFSLLLTVVGFIFNFSVGLIFLVLALFVLQFFRDPKRDTPDQEGVLVSPADGKVISIAKTQDPYADGREALKISVFMNVFNVHSNRMPISGEIQDIQYIPGKFFTADLDKASIENERNAVLIKSEYGLISSVQIAGMVARRIICNVKVGDVLERGQRYGMIRFGSRVDLYLPLNAEPMVKIGQKVSASTTILAKFGDAS
ncbi:MAG: phosphatidylserine decarboxylase [Alcaligenaceae bacterium]|nr:phosphatidylserine decarboxylase [Alcaligenaceae bacterium]